MQCGVRPFSIIPLTTLQLPKSSLGKLSRAKIRTAFEADVFTSLKTAKDDIINSYRASQRQGPTNATEATILSVIADTFAIPEAEIGINTSLFEMGVSSIELIRLKTKIQSALDMKIEIQIITVMTNPTISALASAILSPPDPQILRSHRDAPDSGLGDSFIIGPSRCG